MPSAQVLPHTRKVEVVTFILSLLPRTLATALVFLSCAFFYAAQAVLYSHLDVRDVRDPDALRIFLVMRWDLCSLTHTLRVPAWAYTQTRAYLIPCVLACMENQRLSTPALCLWSTSYTLNDWTSVVFLRFLSLFDDDDVLLPPTPLFATPTLTRLLFVSIPPSRLFLFRTPPLSPLPLAPTPTQDLFTHTATAQLPALAILQGPPHLIICLAYSRPLVDTSITMPICPVCSNMEELEIEGDA
ncbi:hypothetical protein EDD85DRAFT_958580 [Armillaria nabsnona]|nr:hypothetical protein EDD85DRAFT_958580 [Armillaria nabsnona]